MAYSFANAASGGGAFGSQAQGSTGVQVSEGAELREIQTDQLGFLSVNGEAKVRLLPAPWPDDALPPPSCSLLSVASTKGYLAAAGPDCLLFTTTEKVRNALHEKQDDNVRPIKPDCKMDAPRLSQVAFSADENALVVSALDTGGLAAYQVDSLKGGQTAPALQISTNNAPLRALVPNPVPTSAELFAAVTTGGDLLMADLKTGELRSGVNGPVLKSGVSCLSWSNRGKALVAGLVDGTATQLKPDGTVMAEIPKSTLIQADMHVSAISWLENDAFFVVYTSNDTSSDGMLPQSEAYIINRQPKTSNYTFEKFPVEVCPSFGRARLPAFQFITRLRNFPPHIQDLLLVASTTSTDIGLVSKADAPLSKEEPVTGAFTLTTINDDTRRAQLPLSASALETSPIGVGVDFSSKEPVMSPIPSDPEIEQSATPVPSFLLLNNEGILVSWWLIYNDSIREKTRFSGMTEAAVAGDQMQPSQTAAPAAQAASTASTGFGFSAFEKPSTTASAAPAFKTNETMSTTFGQSSKIGDSKSSWTSTGFGNNMASQSGSVAFGQSGFGSSPSATGAAPAFGAGTGLNSGTAAFGKPTFGAAPAFGQSGFGATKPSPFGAAAASPFAAQSAGSGFGAFSNAGGFKGFASAQKDGESPFAKKETASLINTKGNDAFSKPETSSIFGTKPTGNGTFGAAGGFKLGSTFKPDGTASNDLPKPATAGAFGFGGAFDDALSDSRAPLSPTHDHETEMDEKDDAVASDSTEPAGAERGQAAPEPEQTKQPTFTPPSTVIHSKATPAPPLSNLFGSSVETQSTTLANTKSTETKWSFGQLPSTTPKETPGPAYTSLFGTNTQADTSPAVVQKSQPVATFSFNPIVAAEESNSGQEKEEGEITPKIKSEPLSDEDVPNLKDIPERPLPIDATSKERFSPSNTEASSDHSKVSVEGGFPPSEFPPADKTATESDTVPALPEDDNESELSSSFNGSGEDVTEDISPIEEPQQDQTEQLLTSPESSFGREGRSTDGSPTGGVFTKVTSKAPQRQLFGEISSKQFFPPPKPQESPRSPSPVRNAPTTDFLRPEAARSFSAPTGPAQILERRRAELAKSPLAVQAAQEREAAKEKGRTETSATAKARAAEEAAHDLEDDEDEQLRAELLAPVIPSGTLDPFLPYQPMQPTEPSKTGIPGQIERLYQDINSMIDTLGINARTLSSFMLYQQQHQPSKVWPAILESEAPSDVLNEDCTLADIDRLGQGDETLETMLKSTRLSDVTSKLQQCQTLLTRDLQDLRTKVTALRKAIHVRSDPHLSTAAPLSAEQASIQHDLRKASSGVQSKLSEAEQKVTVLRAKLAEHRPAHDGGMADPKHSKSSRLTPQKKPTVEAVANTIIRMTAMAEKKSADIDVLEAQLRRLNVSRITESTEPDESRETNGTPMKTSSALRSSFRRSGASTVNSVYHTPDSNFRSSNRSTPGSGSKRTLPTLEGGLALISAEDKQAWVAQARRRKEVANLVREALLRKAKRSTT